MTKVGHPTGPRDPVTSGGASQPAAKVQAPAPMPMDAVERSASKDPRHATTTALARGLAEPGRERPLDPAIVHKAFLVLEKLFADPAFVAALTALSIMPRIGHIVSAMAAATALLGFLGEWLTRGRSDPLLLASALASLAATLPGAQLAALLGGGVLATRQALGGRRRQRLAATLVSAEQVDALIDELSRPGALTRVLSDEDAFAAYLASLEALRERLDERVDGDAPQGKRSRALFDDILPGLILGAALRLAYGLRDDDVRDEPSVGRAWRLAQAHTGDEIVTGIAALTALRDHNRLDVQAAVRAFNGLGAAAALVVGDIIYVPTPYELQAPLAGWPEIMPLPHGTSPRERQRLVELGALLAVGRPHGLCARAQRLLAVLNKMPARPEAYDLSESAALEPLPA